jgi:hypothetical protein
MDTNNAVSFLIKDLSSVTTEIREQKVNSQDEALIIFDLITACDTQSYNGLPNSAAYIEDGNIKEYDIRLGRDASYSITVEELRKIAVSSASRAGRVDVQDVDTGGRMNKRILHLRAQQTHIHTTDFAGFVTNLYNRIDEKL